MEKGQDTFDKSSNRHQRKKEREQRLAEINQSFCNVVTEAQEKHDDIYKAVFNENGIGIDENELAETQRLAQLNMEQERKNKPPESFLQKMLNSRNTNGVTVPFAVQSDSAGSSLPALPTRFLPSKGFSIDIPRRGGLPHGDQSPKEVENNPFTFDRVVAKARNIRPIIVITVFLVGALSLGIFMTLIDIAEVPPLTQSDMDIVRTVLVKHNIALGPLAKPTTPQYEAVMFLTQEILANQWSVENLQSQAEVTVDGGEVTSCNDAYKEQRLLLERFVLVTLYKSASETKWKKDKNWLKSGQQVCNWHGVECTLLLPEGEDEKNTLVVNEIFLNENKLNGQIPKELGELESLEILYLHGNALTGTVPAELGDLQKLKRLRISENDLSGVVPESVCRLKTSGALTELESSCGGGEGQIECSCCTECI